METSLTLVLGVISSLIAALLVSYVVSINRSVKTLSKSIEETVHPIKEYRDLYTFSEDLVKALREFENDYSRAVLFRALWR